jgi:hypothetical protein
MSSWLCFNESHEWMLTRNLKHKTGFCYSDCSVMRYLMSLICLGAQSQSRCMVSSTPVLQLITGRSLCNGHSALVERDLTATAAQMLWQCLKRYASVIFDITFLKWIALVNWMIPVCPRTHSVFLRHQVLVDQVTYGPVCNVMFLCFTGMILEARPWSDVGTKVFRNYPAVQLNAWRLWPLASLINFKYAQRIGWWSILMGQNTSSQLVVFSTYNAHDAHNIYFNSHQCMLSWELILA